MLHLRQQRWRRAGRAFRYISAAALIAATVGGTGMAAAQTPAPSAASIEVLTTDVTKFPAVALTVALPPTLTPEDAKSLAVTENGTPVPPTVERISTADLQVVLAIDTSGSMAGKPIDAAKAAAARFLDRLPETTPVAIVAFGDKPAVVSSFAASRAASAAAIAALRSRGETSLFDGLVTAGGLFATDAPSRRVIVLLSDGGDTRSSARLGDALDAIGAAKATVHVVSLETKESDAASLRSIAVESGGRLVSAEDTVALASTFDQVAALVVNQYRVSWSATASGPASVELVLNAQGKEHRVGHGVTYPASTNTQPVTQPAPSPAEVTPAPPGQPVISVAPQSMSGARLLWIGLGSIFAALALALAYLTSPAARVRRLAKEFGVNGRHSGSLSRVSDRAVGSIDRAITRSSHRNTIEAQLIRAGLSIGAAEGVTAVLAVAVVAFLLCLLWQGFLFGIAVAVAVILMAFLAVQVLAAKRAHSFAMQLDTTLQLMTSSLRSGYGVAQAVDAVAREAMSPTGEEFRRAVRETRIGRDLPGALRDVAVRMDSEDFGWVVDAIEINREVGGSLAEVLENVSHTLRDRSRLRRQVAALSAEGKLSAIVLVALPILLFFYIRVSNPDYLKPLLNTGTGQLLIVGGLGMLGIGSFWLSRIVKIRF